MFTMSSFLGVTQFSFRSHRRSSAKSKRREPSSSNNSSNTNIPITSAAATFPADTLLDDLENLVQCNTPLAFDNDIYTEQQSQDLQQNPDLHDVSAAPVPEIVPIFHPNEVLLQRFPNKTSFKRPSEIRLHKAHNPSANSTNSNDAGKAPRRNRAGTQPQPYTTSQPQLTTTRRFRSSSLIEHLTRISSRNSTNNDYSSSNDLINDETTTTSLTNITNNAPLSSLSGSHTQANTSNGSPTATTRTTTATPAVISEVSQQYLTRNCVPGTLYVTTERLLFVPNSTPSTAPGSAQFDILISAIDTMKAVQSDAGQWYFLCYEGSYVCTIPFKTNARARSFLKLIANIRFEQMVRRSLPPKYTLPAGGERECGCVAAAASRDVYSVMCGVCAGADNADWDGEDERLPTYSESEEAVRQYLISLGLLAENTPFDRQNSPYDIISLLAQACSPPNRDLESAGSGGAYPRRNSAPETPASASGGRTPGGRRASVPQPRARNLQRRTGIYAAEEHVYTVPLVWI